MYLLLLAVVIGSGYWLIRMGKTRRSRSLWLLGYALIVIGLAFFAFMNFWGEWLWFENLNYGNRFWRFVAARVATPVAGIAAAGITGMLLAYRSGPHVRLAVAGLASLGGLIWGLDSWRVALLFVYGVSTGTTDPMLGFDTGFYLFTLPFLDGLFGLVLYVTIVALVGTSFVKEEYGQLRLRHLQEARADPYALLVANLGLALALVFGSALAVCHLLYSDWGVVVGPGWVDVSIRRPALFVAAAGLLLVGILPFFPAVRRRALVLANRWLPIGRPALPAVAMAWAGIAAVAALVLVVIPALVQWLVVKPNEITFEKPYIAHNIEFTRKGFKLDAIEERQYSPTADFTRKTIEDNRSLLSEVRLWDWRALDAVYKQFQEIRLYYEFRDVDIDRYQIGDRYRQVMVAARELSQDNLPPQSQTFVNRRFKYTHGYGYTLAPVSDFTPEGLPNLLVEDIPPRTDWPELEVGRPEIYYGELTNDPVVVNTREPEFDFPGGEKNVYTRYQGSGGVQLSSFWRKFLFGWKTDGTVFLFSGYPTTDSRIMFRRNVEQRVRTLAPFLVFDQDPYMVAAEGRLFWIVDAYTRSTYYPYSQPFDSREYIESRERAVGASTVAHLDGVSYVRNSVKVVVDAYNGSVDFYIFDHEDPIIRAWSRALPRLFKDAGEMPAALRSHVRYPVDFLLVQGLTYSKYHMSDPAVFYNQEDLWVRATEKHYHDISPVDPYYVMWEFPGSDHAEFVLMLPFTPKNRQVLIGWIAGLCDGDNYGRFLAYKFPKEQRVLGPQQVETKIDQDSFLSGQLTLWDQQGSEVLRGNVLAIPIDNSLLYVEPIYLRANTAAYPELRLVAVMHGDNLSYAPSFDDALLGLLEKGRPATGPMEANWRDLAADARDAFDAYLEALGQQKFDEASRQLEKLSRTLEALVGTSEKNE